MIKLEILKHLLQTAQTTSEEAVEEYFDQIVTCIDQEKTHDAAKLIELVFSKGAADVRLIFYYIYAHFAEHGIKSFAETFPFIITLLNDYPHILLPQKKIEKHIQSSLNWFFSHLLFRIKYYEKMYASGKIHPIWKKSIVDLSSNDLERVINTAVLMRNFFFDKYPQSPTKDKVTHLLKKIEDVRPLVVQTHNPIETPEEQAIIESLTEKNITPASETLVQPQEHDQIISQKPEQAPESNFEFSPLFPKTADLSDASNLDVEIIEEQTCSAASSGIDTFIDQSLLRVSINEFLCKLQAFETLVDRDDHLKAAIVAQDLNFFIDSFDPVTYFPKMFAKYFSLLAKHVSALSEQDIHQNPMQFQALQKLYQTDMDMFIEW